MVEEHIYYIKAFKEGKRRSQTSGPFYYLISLKIFFKIVGTFGHKMFLLYCIGKILSIKKLGLHDN